MIPCQFGSFFCVSSVLVEEECLLAPRQHEKRACCKTYHSIRHRGCARRDFEESSSPRVQKWALVLVLVSETIFIHLRGTHVITEQVVVYFDNSIFVADIFRLLGKHKDFF